MLGTGTLGRGRFMRPSIAISASLSVILLAAVASFALASSTVASAASASAAALADPPESPCIAVVDTLHGVAVTDCYRWLEDGDDPAVQQWTAKQEARSRAFLDALPERSYLTGRYNELWRYDDEGIPTAVVDGKRVFYWVKKKDSEKIAYYTSDSLGAPGRLLIDPNQWPPEEQLSEFRPSRDGRYVAYGLAVGGNERPVIRILDVETGRILPDSLRGQRQRGVSWLPGNEGFYYSAHPLKGEVPEGEESYWSTAWFHRLGTPASEDRKVFSHERVKEYFHGVGVSEDGRWALYYRSESRKNELFIGPAGSFDPPAPIATGFDAQYSADLIGDRLIITTDFDAPMLRALVTDIARPSRQHWKEFIPEDPEGKLSYLNPVAGTIYGVYETKAHTRIKLFDPTGRYLRDLTLPTIGSGSVTGLWSKPDVWVSFSSFVYPSVTYRYDATTDSLTLYKKFPLDVNVSNYTVDQVWYPSKDATPISMFLVRRKDLVQDGDNPTLLYGYGGFNFSQTPNFSTASLVWLEAGGMLAYPNLRGGGEYGKKWHEAGMKEKKQNVFDDMIAAAEYLIAQKYTRPERLGIMGGSNGGLLVGAVAVQRPELMNCVVCQVPLLDMVRYHKFGLANIWAVEYGSAEKPEEFAYLYRYSPYHQVRRGVRYPATLFIAGENDARVDPLHARKMAAAMQAADPGGEPILLIVQGKSGHGGGTTLSMRIGQVADDWSFLMHRLGVRAPGE